MINPKKLSFTFLLIIITFYVLHLPAVSAQSATDSAQGLRDSVKQKVDEQLSQIKQAVSKKAFVGSITTKSDASITISNLTSQPRTILVSTDTTIKLRNGSDGTNKDLTTGSYILVMGDVDSQNTMTAKRLLITTAPAEDKRIISYGQVTKISSSSLTVDTAKKDSYTGRLLSATSITREENSKQLDAKYTDIKVGQKVVFIHRTGTSPTFTDVHIIE